MTMSTKILSNTAIFNIDNTFFLSIRSERFLKDQVTWETEVMTSENSEINHTLNYTGINYTLKYIIIIYKNILYRKLLFYIVIIMHDIEV